MHDILVDNKTIYNFEIAFIKFFSFITKLSILLFMVGFFQEKPLSIIKINYVIKIAIAIFLIYRFNPYRRHKIVFTALDHKVTYSAGVYIFTLSFIDILNQYVEMFRAQITTYTLPIVTQVKQYITPFTNNINL
jgi:hypothetical protein